MPGGDKKGPLGDGPMTGRQLGVCGCRRNQAPQNDEAIYVDSQVMDDGRNFGRGNGQGRGRGNRACRAIGRGNGRGRGFGRGNRN